MTRQSDHCGFTLVEVLVVVLLLGILAAIVVPQFSNATSTARASMLADDLRVMRTQITVFSEQHGGVPPGYPGGDTAQQSDSADFVAQMTSCTTGGCITGSSSDANFLYGPYMRLMPVNPINDLNTVNMIPDGQPVPTGPDGASGWLYQASTLIFLGNTMGSDESGNNYFSY